MLLFAHAATLRVYLLQAFASEFGYETPLLTNVLYWLLFALFLYFIAGVAKWIEPTNHWQHHFDTLHYSSQEFYKALEEAIVQKQMPNLQVSRVSLLEGGVGSAHREYLRVERQNLYFDVCAAPFGHSFFVSWWQGEQKSTLRAIIAAIPFLGKSIYRAFFPRTYYKIDTEEMFKTSIHTLVLNIVDDITKEKGVRGLTELERKPFEAKR